ncbi:MAG: diguanylate cyclase/phosphodiesterase (GGDEF & EAL domains) with PAS/PAC sensor(s) [uncultured Thermomicrobiales bacterium]|uniref:histidine kinase n=1 Tax=uncultured Thermomicrobiales bacterium TaxID=1645740 RepID=A0A6J4V3Q1_9BACT|nr:MAG: diguanylate cyclase/phosphodiesterase (GGDEF & EAL domains) with PAS/PAC sensor(s) [uncultured Thermomicrobiales bacterium]
MAATFPRGAVTVAGGLPFLPATLRGQVVVPIVLAVLLGMTIFGIVLIDSTRNLYVDRLDESLRSEARLVAALAGEQLPAGTDTTTGDAQAFAVRIASSLGARVSVIRPDGVAIGDSLLPPATLPNLRLDPAVSQVESGVESITQGESSPGGPTYRYAASPVLPTAGPPAVLVVRVGLPTATVESQIATVRRLVLVLGATLLVIVMAVTTFSVQRVAAGIGHARSHARRIAGGTIEIDVRPSPVEELGELRSSFNGMVLELQDLVAEIRRSRAELEATLSTLTDGVILTNASGDVVRINAAAARMMSVEAADVIGLPFVMVTRDHELNALHRRSTRTGRIVKGSGIELGFDRRMIDAIVQPVVGDDNQLTLVVLRDQTELRKLEQVRREFVANVSHELRTPLASIRALVETLEAGAMEEPELASDFLGRVVIEVDRLAALVDELLDLARLESGRVSLRLEPLAPADLLRRGAQRLLPQVERARLRLDVDVAPDLPDVLADRSRIEQVLLNLVHNAIKFTPPGGVITVRADVEGDFLVVRVRDTGVGIGAEELPRLFERFYKTDKARRSDGTGLGLAIAKHIVMIHGGTIAVRSIVNEGATFIFTLPLASSKPAEDAREASFLDRVETLL